MAVILFKKVHVCMRVLRHVDVQAGSSADSAGETHLTVWLFFLPNSGTVNAVTQDESGRRLRFALRHGPLPAGGETLRQLRELRGSGGYLREGGTEEKRDAHF